MNFFIIIEKAAVDDVTMHDPAPRTNVDADLHDGTTARPDDFTLQAPGDTGLIEDLHAVGGSVDVQVEALATALTGDVEEKSVADAGRRDSGTTSEEASQEPKHHDLLARTCALADRKNSASGVDSTACSEIAS